MVNSHAIPKEDRGRPSQAGRILGPFSEGVGKVGNVHMVRVHNQLDGIVDERG
jgi:hypothetical protein